MAKSNSLRNITQEEVNAYRSMVGMSVDMLDGTASDTFIDDEEALRSDDYQTRWLATLTRIHAKNIAKKNLRDCAYDLIHKISNLLPMTDDDFHKLDDMLC